MILRAPELVALGIMISFTTVMTGMLIYSQGALIYFYEPSKAILWTEVALGLYAIFLGIVMMWRRC